MNENYSIARGYAYKLLHGRNYIDLVHDAFLTYFYRHGKNLFEEPTWLVLKVMRDAGVNLIRKLDGRGQYKYRYQAVADGDRVSTYGPLETVSADQLVECIESQLSPSERHTLSLRLEGYTAKEISDRVGIGRQGVDYRLHKVQKLAAQLLA